MKILQQRYASFDAPQQIMQAGVYPYFRAIEGEQSTEVVISGKKVLMFGSNSYLGLTNHPKVKEAALDAIRKYGTGCAGSRFLNGTLDIHIELEQKMAEFVGKDEAIVFSTGYQVNQGALPALTGRQDYIIIDELVHASIMVGRQLSPSITKKFKHNDMASLERVLKSCDPDRIKLIVVDGVFSMEGDIANLPEIVRLAKQYGASIYVDEAHGLGVLGPQGRGTCHHFGVADDVDLIMGTFSKSLATIGGFIAGDKEVINFLRHNARSYIFSASNTPAATAGTLAALEIMKSEPERIQHLWDLTHHALDGFRNAGFEIGHTETPIIPLYIRDNDKTFLITQRLYEDGVFVNPVVAPAVASNSTLIRFSLMATHSFEQVDIALDKLKKHGKALGII
jgi:8-amino-7-oxononanoate synthase